MADLQPGAVKSEDSGTSDLESSDDHFSDAPEGSDRSTGSTAVPVTRVERVDDEPRHGETPGTAAYEKRKADASPDELEVVPEDSDAQGSDSSIGPSGNSIPTTVVDKVDPNTPSYGEVPNTPAQQLRKSDAEPDMVRQAPEVATNQTLEDDGGAEDAPADDDFDDFAEGDEDDDFGAFDEADDEDAFEDETSHVETKEQSWTHLKPLQFDGLSSAEEIQEAGGEYLAQIFPHLSAQNDDSPGDVNQAFLTERSQSLWAQLVAPPPLQPPDWVRSRIRRLFLVSLGVPVDLDEILPASKQKKLVLPTVDSGSGRRSVDAGSLGRLKQGGKNASSSSVGSAPSRAERRRRGPPPPPDFDENSARLICSITDIALSGMTDAELRIHVERVEELKQAAMQTLEYWLIQKDSAAGDKEAFEEVIENLVKHAKKIRK